MTEDLSWFGIKWNLGPSSDDFPAQSNESNGSKKINKTKDIDTNKMVGRKQRKKLKKSEKNPEQIVADFKNTDLIVGKNKKPECEEDSVSLLGVKSVPEECQGKFFVESACKVRISRACSTHVKNENENESSVMNCDENYNEIGDGERDRSMGVEDEEKKIIKKKRLDFLQSEIDEKMVENRGNIKNNNENNNDTFLFGFNLGLFKSVYCQSKRIPLYLEAWKFLLKKKLSKILFIFSHIIVLIVHIKIVINFLFSTSNFYAFYKIFLYHEHQN
jgi:hypothetical protein